MPHNLQSRALTAVGIEALLLVPMMAQLDPLVKVIGPLKMERSRITEYVKVIKGRYSSAAPQYRQAQILYIEVYSAYSGWVSTIKAAILTDSLADVEKEQTYRSACGQAEQAGKRFVDYYKSLPLGPQSRNPAVILGALTSLAGPVASAVGSILNAGVAKEKNRFEMRLKMAELFESEAAWQPWDKI